MKKRIEIEIEYSDNKSYRQFLRAVISDIKQNCFHSRANNEYGYYMVSTTDSED